MDMREDIFYQFFQELIESYRHDILQREDVKELAQKRNWTVESDKGKIWRTGFRRV